MMLSTLAVHFVPVVRSSSTRLDWPMVTFSDAACGFVTTSERVLSNGHHAVCERVRPELALARSRLYAPLRFGRRTNLSLHAH
eukprot:4521246-Pleurochrysis_carterae.AAC.2